MKFRLLGTAFAVLSLAAFSFLVPAASASVMGHLDLTNCNGGGVVVTTTTIDWLPPSGGPDGCIVTGIGTNLLFGAGSLGPGVTGSILDLNAGNPLPVSDFITFASAPTVHFDLSSLGPGPTNTVCTNSFNPNATPCAVFAGSPFVLQSTTSGTAVTLAAAGVARDGTAPDATWIGAFTTQIAGRTPAQIQANILGGGSERSTYSGDFTLTVVPEPATLGSMLLGGLLLAGGMWRRKRA